MYVCVRARALYSLGRYDKDLRAKLCDFGLSSFTERLSARFESRVGTPAWMAPEVLNGERYSLAADVWSVGVIAWGELPQLTALVCYRYNRRCCIVSCRNRVFSKKSDPPVAYSRFMRILLGRDVAPAAAVARCQSVRHRCAGRCEWSAPGHQRHTRWHLVGGLPLGLLGSGAGAPDGD